MMMDVNFIVGLTGIPLNIFEHESDAVNMINGVPPKVFFYCHNFLVIQRRHAG